MVSNDWVTVDPHIAINRVLELLQKVTPQMVVDRPRGYDKLVWLSDVIEVCHKVAVEEANGKIDK